MTDRFEYINIDMHESYWTALRNGRLAPRVAGQVILRIPAPPGSGKLAAPGGAQGIAFISHDWGHCDAWRFSAGVVTLRATTKGHVVSADVELSPSESTHPASEINTAPSSGRLNSSELIIVEVDRGVPANIFWPGYITQAPELAEWLKEDAGLEPLIVPRAARE